MYRIEIDELTPSLNAFYAGCHWTKRKAIVDYWHTRWHLAFKQAKLPKPLQWPVTLTCTQYSKGIPKDVDNAVIAVKLAGDALKLGGYLPDDSPKYISTVILQSKKSDNKQDKVVLIIQDYETNTEAST